MDKKSPAFQSECRGFSDGAVCPVRCVPLRRYAGREWGGEQTACARQKPAWGRVFHLLRQLMWKEKALLRHVAHQSGTEKSPAFQSECREFLDGGSLPGAVRPCSSAPETSGSGKPDQLTPVLSAGTVMGRAGCVKSRSVQTFPHFAGRPVENRGRPGDRKNRLSQWNSRF